MNDLGVILISFFFQADDGIRDGRVTGVQTSALPISMRPTRARAPPPSPRSDAWCSMRRCSSCSRRSGAACPRAPNSTTCRCSSTSPRRGGSSACCTRPSSSTPACRKATGPPWLPTGTALTLKALFMRATLLAALCGALACSLGAVSAPARPYVALAPVLDSLFVGDARLLPSVTYFDGRGNFRTPSPNEIHWQSSDTTVLRVDTISRSMTARGRGIAIVVATVNSVPGQALVAVSNTLDLTLLLDTVYARRGDTLIVPVAVKNRPPDPVVWYEASPSTPVYTIDSATGRLIATAPGGPVPYIVHADTIADTGAVYVLSPSDITGGRFFFSVLGTANTHVSGSIRAVNYTRTNANLAFPPPGTSAP